MRMKADVDTIPCFPLDHNKFVEVVYCLIDCGKMSYQIEYLYVSHWA